MRLEVPYKRVGDIDVDALERVVTKLEPMFADPAGGVWPTVEARYAWIGKSERPADVGFRKMQPTKYAQLCVLNDEDPLSPWAVRIPPELIPIEEQRALADSWSRLLAEKYGEGVLYFAVFAVLGPGGVIPKHRDMPHDANKKLHSHHLHAPITAAEDCEFSWADSPAVFERGGLYEVDNIQPHSAINKGARFRVNLMLDYCPSANMDARNAAGRDARSG